MTEHDVKALVEILGRAPMSTAEQIWAQGFTQECNELAKVPSEPVIEPEPGPYPAGPE